MGRKAVVFSGGQDSTTCLMLAIAQGHEVTALCFDYGQRHEVEVEVARKICRALDVPLVVVAVPSIQAVAASSLLGDQVEEGERPATFVPGRNLLFLTLAYIWALKNDHQAVVTGVLTSDSEKYPDTSADFIRSLNGTLSIGIGGGVEVEAPLQGVTKAEGWALLEKVCGAEAVEFVRVESHTCYEGVRNHLHNYGYGCGACLACETRRIGWEKYHVQNQ